MSKFMSIIFALLFANQAAANIVITGTRVIYPSDEGEITVKLSNNGKVPVLIQSWIDDGNINASPDSLRVPFVITPPINRVDAQKGQVLRVSFTKEKELPKDRESLFWLNVLEIPPKGEKHKGDNQLQIAFRTRIKLFFRPSSIEGNSTDAAEKLQWAFDGNDLVAINNSPYYVTLLEVHDGKNKTGDISEMVPPFGRLNLKVNSGRFVKGEEVNYSYVNDWGAVKEFKSKI
ncbi:fimbria/pilus periplasmic chaperone [Aeromonas jandaei]|uniref:fimbrial biogenesis chaperone n=1 Tax=Aeromonas jandaei TaxID=650 RepID=UPI0019323F00|nr:fimbria/pilus periplasmic chaperone [Aeromonas jandaei]MBM0493198.1 fimbria/pilus periplasmic chaperone [Aeromonas jandaei]MBM0570931.1 fimbria/pilus periplasmic chaperone [Aeromonas jandaei]